MSHQRILNLLLATFGLFLTGCDFLQNSIDKNTLACGSLGNVENFTWLQIENEKAEILDLNSSTFSLVDADLRPLPSGSYRISSKGCLGVPRQQEFIVRIPGKKSLFKKYDPNDQPFQLLSLQSLETPLQVSLEPSRKVYQGRSSVRVISSEKSKSKYCLENVNQPSCITSSDLNSMVSRPEFQALKGAIELPSNEGGYRLHILSEAPDGSLGLHPFDFTIDNKAPRVIPDFTERLPIVPYFGRPTYFIDAGYPIKFLSFNDSLKGTHIEYCVLSQDNPALECPRPEIYGLDNSLTVPKGASKLVYRAFDDAGNGATEGWQSVSMIARASCRVSDFLKSLSRSESLNCQILEGDLDLSTMETKFFPILDRFVEVTGTIQFKSETASTVPLFQNLNSAFGIDFNLGAELEGDFVSFPQLRNLKELTLRLSMGGKSIQAFNGITQMLRVNLANLENVKTLDILRNLKVVDDYLWIYSLDTISNLDFLSALTRAGHLRIRLCDELQDLKALKNLTSVSIVELTTNPKLASLKGLEGIVFIEKLVLSGLGIRDFTGLENLKEVTFGLWVESNPELVSVKGLGGLQKLSYFLFRNNDRLPEGTQLLGQTIEQ
jgi:hypothetical protein